jgi:hypothetical protein
MAKRRKGIRRDEVRPLINRVRALKDKATGRTWSRLHGIESQLSTVAGSKRAIPSKQKKAKRKRAKRKSA